MKVKIYDSNPEPFLAAVFILSNDVVPRGRDHHSRIGKKQGYFT